MLIDTNLGPIIYDDTEIYITNAYVNIGNDGTNDYLDYLLSLIDIELGERIDGDTGNVSNAILIADGTNGKTLKASVNVVIDNEGQLSIGGTKASATVDITQTSTNVKGFELNGINDSSSTLFQINEGNGINTGNLVEVNRYGGIGGDAFLIKNSYIGINNIDPEKYLDVNGDSRIVGDFTVGFSSWNQIGNGLDVNQVYSGAMTRLTSTRIVYIDIYNDKLRVYDWDGNDWTKTGNDFHINNNGYNAIAALNSTDIAFIDDNNNELRLYRFDGSDWSQIGSSLSLSGVGVPALTALNSTDVAFFDSGNDELRTYRWNSSNWSQVGNSYTLGQTHTGTLTALNDSTIVLADNYEDRLKTFRWDGTDWHPIGNTLHIGSNYPSLTTLNNTDIAVVDNNNKELRVYRWNNSDWAQIGPSFEITGMGVPTITSLSSTEVAYVDDALDELRVYKFSDVVALSTNHHKVGVGVGSPTRIFDLRGSCSEDLVNIAVESGISVLKIDYDGLLGIWEEEPETVVELTHTEPYITLHNSTEQDSDGGRESKIIFKGEQTGGEESTLGIIEVSHSGTLDNERGKISFYTNDGNDGNSPTLAMFIDYTGYINLADTKNQITTGGLEIVLEQTGDSLGASKFHVRNRVGNSGILIENITNDFSDCNFIGDTGYESGLRYEHRSGSIIGGPDNSIGEFQFIDDITDSSSAFFSTNKEATIVITGNFGVGETNPETTIEATSELPQITLHNNTNEDDEGGRESGIIFKGHQSGGEESTLAIIKTSHDGTADDQRGKLSICINNGNDGDNPTEIMTFSSYGYVGVNQSSPSTSMFEVIQNASDIIGVKVEGSENRTQPLLQINEGIGTTTANLFEINSNSGSGGDLFVVNYRGDVGITTTLPDEPLHVRSDFDGNRGIRMQNEDDGVSAVARYIVDIYGGSAFLAAYGSNFTTSGSKRANSASLITNASMANGLSLVARNITGGNIRFYTGGNADANERAIFRVGGEFGLGTNLPDKLFEINKSTGGEMRLSYNAPTGSATDYCDLSINSNGSLTVTTVDSDGDFGHINLNPDGNVGINLSDPIQKFHIGGTTGDTFVAITNTSTGHTASNGIAVGLDSTNDGIFWNYEDRDLAFGTNNLERMRIFSDGSVRIGDLTTNYSSFAPDGELTLHGTARVWRCVDLEPSNVGKPSTNPPDIGEYQGFEFDRFDRGTEEQVYFLWHIPTDFAIGDASVRGHFGLLVENPPSGTGDEAVVMGFEYKKISPNDTFDFSSGTTTGTITETITDGEAAYKWHATSVGTCVTTGWAKEDIILFRFYRDATNANDTYDNEVLAVDNDVWVGVYHLEYLRNSLGEAS